MSANLAWMDAPGKRGSSGEDVHGICCVPLKVGILNRIGHISACHMKGKEQFAELIRHVHLVECQMDC